MSAWLLVVVLAAPPAAAVEPDPAPRPWAWVGFGTAAFAFVGAGLLHATALDTLAEAESYGPGRVRDDAVAAYEQQRISVYVSYGAGVLALGVGLYFLLTGGDGDPADVPASLGPDGIEVRVRW